jgi:alpha-1,2-glucosyltransferase
MLYLWPAIVFFSWPVTLPFVVNIFTNKWNKLPLRSRFPRTATIVSFLVIAAATICFNTIIHPFSLADNRHYTFYMFRLLRIPTIKYAAIPVYVFCGWLCISALSTPATSIKTQDQDIVRVSWVLVFLISTSLSLITAPLVEPRYFIIPWLIWRLHVPEATPDRSIGELNSTDDKTATQMAEGTSVLRKVISYSTWLELVWYIAINVVIGYMFLFRGFLWPQEPGKVQRFMW